MQTTTGTAPGKRVIEVDEVTLRSALWALAAVGLVAAVLLADRYVLSTVIVAAIVALGAVWYAENEVARDFPVSIDRAWVASIRSLAAHGLDYDARRTRRGITEGQVTAGDSRVRIESHAGGITRVRVRVGLFSLPDNRRREALIVERIVRDLELPAAPAGGAD